MLNKNHRKKNIIRTHTHIHTQHSHAQHQLNRIESFYESISFDLQKLINCCMSVSIKRATSCSHLIHFFYCSHFSVLLASQFSCSLTHFSDRLCLCTRNSNSIRLTDTVSMNDIFDFILYTRMNGEFFQCKKLQQLSRYYGGTFSSPFNRHKIQLLVPCRYDS